MHHIIVKLTTEGDSHIVCTFANGEIVRFDASSLFQEHPEFQTLRDRRLFENAVIDGFGYGISWNDELDLSSDGIYRLGEHIGKAEQAPHLLLAEALAEAREKAGISQRELSRRSGVIQAEISKIEQGKGNPTLMTLRRLAHSLGLHVADLFQ